HGPRPRAVDERPPAHERPQVAVEGAALALDRKESLGVAHRRVDLEAIAHDARIPAQAGAGPGVEARHLARVEAHERAAVTGALVQDGRPRQPGLRALERQHLEQPPLIVHRTAPFQVVVAHVVRVVRPRPPAAAPGAHSRSLLAHVFRSALGCAQSYAGSGATGPGRRDLRRSRPQQTAPTIRADRDARRLLTNAAPAPDEGVRHDDGLEAGFLTPSSGAGAAL